MKKKKLWAALGFAKPFTLLLPLLLQLSASAQVFNPAILPEYPYPVPGTIIPGPFPNPVNTTKHTFTYTMGHIAYMNPYVAPPMMPPPPPYTPANPPFGNGQLSDLTLHSWDDPGSTAGLAWINKATGSGTPGTIYDQGFMMYPAGVQDIEMSLQQDQMGYAMFIWGTNAPWYVIVSFYNSNPLNYTGVGHYVETYLWNNPIPIGTGGLTFINRTQLSNIGTYTRIRQDGHNTYGFAITWEDPNPNSPTWGINHVQGFMNNAIPGVSMSAPIHLAGTGGESFPDVAFRHDGSGLTLQFIYQSVNGGGFLQITSSNVPFILGPAWPVVLGPVVTDVNVTALAPPANVDVHSRIDAPDHGPDNWAYVYTLPPYNQVSVRWQNCTGPCFWATYVVNDGTLGNFPIDVDISGVTHLNDWPTISFDATTTYANVGWYTQYQFPAGSGFFAPNIGGYVGLQLDENGALTWPMDYMQTGLNFTGSNLNASFTPSIAYSRQNDRTDYHYLVFANQMCPGPAAQIQTKERPWTMASFKGGSHDHHGAEELYASSGEKASLETTASVIDNIIAFPNPFSGTVSLALPNELLDQTLTVSLGDVTGREINSFTGKGRDVNTFLDKTGDKLAAGSYFITLKTGDDNLKKTIKVQKLANEAIK